MLVRSRILIRCFSCPAQLLISFGNSITSPTVLPFTISTLLAVQTGLLAYSATRHSPTQLEPAFVASGLSHLALGRFDLYKVNPPLPRMIAATPPLLSGYNPDWSSLRDEPGTRPEYSVGLDFVRANGPRTRLLVVYARWACIPFALIGSCIAYCWARDLYGKQAGLAALVLYIFEPSLLAHGELATPDSACVSLGLAANYFYWKWITSPSVPTALYTGGLLGLCQLSKFTWLILFALWPMVWICHWLMKFDPNLPLAPSVPNRNHARTSDGVVKQTAQGVLIFVVAITVINCGYGFDGTFTPLKDYMFVSKCFAGLEESGAVGNRFRDDPAGCIWVPLPKQYILGIDLQTKDFESYPEASYLCGEWRNGGWWYYYIFGILVKTPCGTLVLFSIAVLRKIFLCRPMICGIGEFLLLCAATSVLAAVSWHTEFNHHLRYSNPVVAFCAIFAAQTVCPASPPGTFLFFKRRILGTANRLKRNRLGSTIYAWLPVFASTLEFASCYPHHLAFFNLLARASSTNRPHFLGSNLDWGQDWYMLTDWSAASGNSERLIALAPPWLPDCVPQLRRTQACRSGDLLAVSVNLIFDSNPIANPSNRMKLSRSQIEELKRCQPVHVIGGTIFVYKCSSFSAEF